MPQVPYSPPGAEQGQHMYVDIYQALYRDRIMLVGNFLDEEQANSLIALLLFMRFEDPRKPISIYFNVPGALMKPCLAVYDTLGRWNVPSQRSIWDWRRAWARSCAARARRACATPCRTRGSSCSARGSTTPTRARRRTLG